MSEAVIDKPTEGADLNALIGGFTNAVNEFKEVTKGLNQTIETKKKPNYEPGKGQVTKGLGENVFWATSGEVGKDSRPYSILNVVKMLQQKNKDYAKLECLVSHDMKMAGYQTDGGWLIPFDPDSIENHCPNMRGLKSLLMPNPEAFDPQNMYRAQKALSAYGPEPDGGALINPTLASSVLELLRAKVVTVEAGATEIQLPPSGQYTWARQTQDPTFSWVGENVAISSSQPAFGNVLFSAKKAAALVFLSNDSLLFTNPAIEVVVRQSLAEKGARFEDIAFLEGTGGSYQPLGIINQSGITSHTANYTPADGNTGYIFQPEDVLSMIAKVEEANDPQGITAFVMRPLLWAAIANRRADSVSAGDGKGAFMWWTTRGDMTAQPQKMLSGVKVLTTTALSQARTRGSASNLSYVLGGNFRRAMIARSGAMEINAASTGEEFKADQTVIRAIFRLDFQVSHTKPFVLCDQLQIA